MFLKSIDASANVKDAHLIFSLLANVVEEVGVANIVQVITDNATNYVAAGRLLCAKYPTLFWTPCTAHCIDLMLEDIGKLEWVQDIVQECKHITKYIYNHAWVLNLMREFTHGELSRPTVARFIEPLVKVSRLMDGEKPAMGYIYEGMVRAKEAIKTFYKGNESKYKPIWQIIDSRWDRQLHSPLHAVGAYLNPSLFYNEGSSIQRDPEVMRGVMICIEKMFPNVDIQDKINLQLDMYKEATSMFGFSSSQRLKDKKMPYCGTVAPQLQKFAIRVLSQPCSASSCECSWSVFEHIHNKKRNKLEHERLEKLVFIYYNLRMLTKHVHPKDTVLILLDTIDLEFDWVVEEEAPDLSWLDEETEDLSHLPSQMETPNTHALLLL
eukprot:PITA_15528